MMLVFLDARMAMMLIGRPGSEKADFNPEVEIRTEITDHIREALFYYRKRKVGK
jgi:hypothetical protein